MKKNSQSFGQDPANTSAILKELLALAAAHPEAHWAALVDAAFDYPVATEKPYWHSGINCYDSPEYEGLGKAAPMLIPIDIYNDQEFVSRLVHHCHDRPMISFLASRVALNDLCDAWRPLHWITAVDDQRMLLRLADTRVLSGLSQALKPDQWAAIAAPVACWVAVNRTGRLKSLNLPKPDELRAQKIQLDQDQLGTLLASAEPDNVLSLISESMSDVFPAGMRGSQRYEMVSESCALARKHGIENWSDIVSLSVAAFLTKGELNQDKSLADYLARRQWAPGDLGTCLVSERFV
jgi:hypothetical protein